LNWQIFDCIILILTGYVGDGRNSDIHTLGNGRLEAMCIDGNERLCIEGKMRKVVLVAQGDIILLGLREY
jgi:initiation factor 1A